MIIGNVKVTTQAILNCYSRYYPDTYKQIVDKNRFHYLNLFGIRTSTCDTALPDDIIGGIRVNNFGFVESILASASTEPSPDYVRKAVDASAARAGGTAWIMEGQHAYNYMYKRMKQWLPYGSWCPVQPMKVYRWNPTAQQIAEAKKTGKALSSYFDEAVRLGKVTISTSPDTCIHRAWNDKKLSNDSAGCVVVSDHAKFEELTKWAESHNNKDYGNIFIYTLFTRNQFLTANGVNTATAKPIAKVVPSGVAAPQMFSDTPLGKLLMGKTKLF